MHNYYCLQCRTQELLPPSLCHHCKQRYRDQLSQQQRIKSRQFAVNLTAAGVVIMALVILLR